MYSATQADINATEVSGHNVIKVSNYTNYILYASDIFYYTLEKLYFAKNRMR